MGNDQIDEPRGPRNRPQKQMTFTLPFEIWQRLQRVRNRSATVELALRLYYNLPPEGFERDPANTTW